MASSRGLSLPFPAPGLKPGRRPGERWDAVVAGALVVMGLAFGVLAGLDPKLAIAAAIGLGFAGLVLANITVGLCLFALISFLEVLNSSFGVAKLVGFLLALSWLAVVTTRDEAENDFIGAHPGITYLLALFVGWTAASAVWAESAPAALDFAFRYLQNALLFLIVYTAVREPKHARWVAGSFLSGATIAAMFAILNPPAVGQYDVVRATGTIGDPNELAAVLVAGLILGGTLFSILRRSPALRLTAAVGSVLCAVGLFSTFSRGGLVALGCALVAAMFVGGRWRGRAVAIGVTAALGAVLFFAMFAPKQASERITKVDGGTGRTDIWNVGGRMVEAHPIRGVGAGNFQVSAVHYVLKPGSIRYDYFIDHPKVAHNTYLQVLAELGFVGLGLFLTLIVFAFTCIVKAARRFAESKDRDMELLTRGVLLALIGILAADFFISGQFSKQLWLLLGMCPALLAIASRTARTPKPSSAPRLLRY
jgi:putative inorganic carbon (hco3(-)) transporter